MENRNADLEKNLKEMQTFQKNIFEKFKHILSARQIYCIGDNKPIFRYDSSEIISALQIRYSSPRAYKILQTFLPIPSVSTLKRWVNKIDCEPGFQNFIFDLLKQKSLKMDNVL